MTLEAIQLKCTFELRYFKWNTPYFIVDLYSFISNFTSNSYSTLFTCCIVLKFIVKNYNWGNFIIHINAYYFTMFLDWRHISTESAIFHTGSPKIYWKLTFKNWEELFFSNGTSNFLSIENNADSNLLPYTCTA